MDKNVAPVPLFGSNDKNKSAGPQVEHLSIVLKFVTNTCICAEEPAATVPCIGLTEKAPTCKSLAPSPLPFAPLPFPSLLSGRVSAASTPPKFSSLNWKGNTPVFANSMLRGADCVL